MSSLASRIYGKAMRWSNRLASSLGGRFERRCARWGTRSGLGSAMYYLLFSAAFRREQRGVLAGRARYEIDCTKPTGSAVLLRRNVHRLEKGLLMRPRRVPFALDYIGETVECYARVTDPKGSGGFVSAEELLWAHDVLAAYFAACPAEHPRLMPHRERFLAVPAPSRPLATLQVPYCREQQVEPPVSYEHLLTLARHRRSVRWFLPRPVPREAIDRALVVGGLSPTACNRQPYFFRVFDEPSLVQKVARIPGGLQGYAENIPVIAVLIGRQRCYFSERDRHLIYIDGSLATMAFLFALETQGIASCCVNWPDIEEKETSMAELLSLEVDERPVMLIALGYPDPTGLVACSTKKPLSEIRGYNLEHGH